LEHLLQRAAEYVAQQWRTGEFWWVTFGFLAQGVFFTRFLVQWIASEREKRSVIPTSFWFLSLVGGLMTLVYAVHIRNPVFSLASATSVFIYLRNIILIQGGKGRDFSYVVLLFLASAVLFLAGDDIPALWASSEARAAEIAREMYTTGDYVVPHLNGEAALTKPPLYHWMAALSYRVFGVGEMAARFPSAVAGLLAILATYLLGRRMFDSTVGFLAAMMTASSSEFAWNARLARTDMVYTFFTIAAITAFVYAATSKRHRKSLYILFFALMGLAFMTKGPAGLLLPLVSGAAYLYLTGEKAQLAAIPWLAGAAVFLVITLPWHLAAILSVGPQDREYFIWGQIARWSSGQGGERRDATVYVSFLYYVPALLKGFFPWSFFLPVGLWAAWKHVRAKRNNWLVLPFVWFVVGLAAFSLSGTRASRYMLPLLPAGALMVAYLWREAAGNEEGATDTERAQRATRLLTYSLWPLAATSIILSAVVAMAPSIYSAAKAMGLTSILNAFDQFMVGVWATFLGQHPWVFGTAAGIFGLTAFGALFAAEKRRMMGAFALLVVVVIGFLCIYVFALVPTIDGIYNVKPFTERLNKSSDGGPYAWVGSGSLETLFYMGRHYDTVRPDDVRAYLEKDPKALVLAWTKDVSEEETNPNDYESWPDDVRNCAQVVFKARLRHREAVVLAPLSRPVEASPREASPEEASPREAGPEGLRPEASSEVKGEAGAGATK
jgi:4-amino-4-deoxy-L-arabinose transferase-like glycosyltransferase/lipid-A-disaccharide synthase-like uncharacterized protein